jgi:hypothetical protein
VVPTWTYPPVCRAGDRQITVVDAILDTSRKVRQAGLYEPSGPAFLPCLCMASSRRATGSS